MKFGKLTNISDVDFKLPDVPSQTTNLLSTFLENGQTAKIYIGTTGWANKDWKGIYYPKKALAKDFLNHYSDQLDSIELNTTHYRIPTSELVQSWVDRVGANFKFCPKIPQQISHRGILSDKKQALDLFSKSILEMDKKLGLCFLQLPESFNFNQIDDFKRFLDFKPVNLPLALELRNHNWFKNEREYEDLYHVLIDYNVSNVLSDVSGRRDVLNQWFSTEKLIIRFVGNALDPTDYQRIDEWIKRLHFLIASGLKEVYFFFHQPKILLVPKLINYFVKEVNKHPSLGNLIEMREFSDENTQLELF